MSLTPTAQHIMFLVEADLKEASEANFHNRAVYEATCAWRKRWLKKHTYKPKSDCPHDLTVPKLNMKHSRRYHKFMRRVKRVAERVLADEHL